MNDDSYARDEQKRKAQYQTAYESDEVKSWIASLPPETREKAESMGLLTPQTEWGINGHSIDQLLPCYEPCKDDSYDDKLMARPLQKRKGYADLISSDGWASALCGLDADKESMLAAFLQQDGNPRLRWACICYLLGQGTCESLAQKLGMTKQAFHHHVRKMEKQLGLPPMANQRSEKVRDLYRKNNKRRS